jgi:hypothetical protein
VARLGSAGRAGDHVEFLERCFECFGPRPRLGQVQLGAAAGEREAGGDVQQSVAQPFRFSSGELAVQAERLGQTSRSCASITISTHTSFIANCWNGSLARPVSLSSRIRSSTRARWRWRRSTIAMSESVWSVRIAWKRYPSVVGE